MKSFSSLLKHAPGKPPGNAQKKARAGFSKAVSRSRLVLRKPCEPLPEEGRHFVVGIATYSAEDLTLLDELQASQEASAKDAPDIQVFDVLDCRQMEDFEKYIPGMSEVFRTPIIGVLAHGRLIDHATGLSDVRAALERFHVLHHG